MPAYVITYLQVTDPKACEAYRKAPPHAVSVSAHLTSRSALSPR